MPRKPKKARPLPHITALGVIRERLATDQLEKNLAAFAAVHSASLHWTDPDLRKSDEA